MTDPGSVLSPKGHPPQPNHSLVLSRALENHYVIFFDFTQQQPLVILFTGTVYVQQFKPKNKI